MPNLSNKVRVAEAAERQFGRVTWAQLQVNGISKATIAGWCRDGYLHPELPHVYAVGSKARTIESDLAAALLYAGPGAALSHATAAWWLGLIDERPRRIHVSTPRKCRSLPSVRVYDRRERTRTMHKGLAVTTIPETLVDLAAVAPFRTLRRALANAEYRYRLDLATIDGRRGAPGAAKLRRALHQHQPALAFTKSQLEQMLLEICEAEHLPIPEINTTYTGWEVDALWRNAKLAVELDGYGNHHTPGQLRRDRRKEMALRQAGLKVHRYSGEQLQERTAVVAEIRDAL
jgi:very-short-patch-repair endonuclease